MTIERVAGSFRDPSGYVFFRGQRVFRAIDDQCHAVLDDLSEQGRFAELMRRQLIVNTDFIEPGTLLEELREDCPDAEHFLEHQRLPAITHPYEWSISMLADAGIHTIDLQLELLNSGCSLKDATAYNVQFVAGKPTMIDVASIERARRLDVWFAYGQFLQMFLYPLLLCRFRGWDLRSYFQANLNGRDIESVGRSFSWLEKLRPGLLFDLSLPLWLHRWSERQGTRSSGILNRDALDQPATNSNAQVLNLQRLRRKLENLAAGYKPRGIWASYTEICNYDCQAEQAKRDVILQHLQNARPQRVLDLGCNTGEYSRLAAKSGAQVLAADADHDAVEVLFRSLRDKPANITPIVVDLANPSPAIGQLNTERASFFERAQSDCVFALALMHHLLVSANMTLEGVRDTLLALTQRDLVLEFVPTDDDMFRRLVKYRVDLFDQITLENCRRVFAERFEILSETSIPHSKRTLLVMRRH